MNLNALKFPIGHYEAPSPITPAHIKQWIDDIASFPERIKAVVSHLTLEQLNWVYRPEGWTIKQVVHHCADSHINSIVRFKLALTEDVPEVRPYNEARWAELVDSLDNDISDSLQLLTAVHRKWVQLLQHMNEDDLKREFTHPEYNHPLTIAFNIGNYAWHCNHHLAHIEQAIAHQGEF